MRAEVIDLRVRREVRAFATRVRPGMSEDDLERLVDEWLTDLYARRTAGDTTAAAVLEMAQRQGIAMAVEQVMKDIGLA